jgi:PAS domain-containing protein
MMCAPTGGDKRRGGRVPVSDFEMTGADESNALFRLAMEHSAVGMALVAPDGSFLMVNPALCSMRDCPRFGCLAGLSGQAGSAVWL